MRDTINAIIMIIGFLFMVSFVGYILVGCEVKEKQKHDATETKQNEVKELVISTNDKACK